MNELKKEMQSRWNEHADSYDSSEAHGLSNPWAIKRWSGLLEGKQGQTLLDVGCGTGFVSLLAAKTGLKVTGVDWSEGMMGRAKEKAKEENLEITFVCSDTEALPFASDTFQNLTARHVIWTPSPRSASGAACSSRADRPLSTILREKASSRPTITDRKWSPSCP